MPFCDTVSITTSCSLPTCTVSRGGTLLIKGIDPRMHVMQLLLEAKATVDATEPDQGWAAFRHTLPNHGRAGVP